MGRARTSRTAKPVAKAAAAPTSGRARTGGTDFDVLIVGAGPTGLLAACELLRRRVRVRIIDRALEPMQAPKALSLWPRALDIMTDLGVGDAIRQASVRINAFSYFSNRRLLASFGFPPDLAARQLPQPETERVLTERLHSLGGKVERGVRLLCLDDLDFSPDIDATDGVTAVLEYGNGLVERARAPFVIGADGASSSVRGQLGVGFRGTTYEMAFALIDTRIKGSLPSDEIRYYQTPAGTLVVVPQPDSVFRFLSVMPEGGEMSVPMMQSIIDERGPRGVRITKPVWNTVFRVHARHATEFRRGRVFLIGDAAHVHSPAGGQGMNNGLQDAHNLAWKLASVIHGQSPSSLLPSYGPERLEATRRIVRDTDLQTRAWMAKGPAQIFLRDNAFRLLDRTGVVSRFYTPVMAGRRLSYTPVRETQRPGARTQCSLRQVLPGGVRIGTVLPRGLAVSHGISGPEADPLGWTIVALAPPNGFSWRRKINDLASRWSRVRVVTLSRDVARENAFCGRPGYYLVRPDGHVVAHGHERDLDRLETELGTVLLPG
ncbi:oxygenase [Longimycelium tulufanense]|uniref:Oxygenase n=1 Tax=Longimycelium tulufanense TaxID=907463 RepID=A0A8J3FS57_9PSEU|nr:FAD-dependent monooxygenase [Longimycelium tulufanense]GGM33373.1 oxygenase [Longimycelium tulufanense]